MKQVLIYVFNIPFGRYKFLRLPFGVCSAPEKFQKETLQTFSNIEVVEIIVDDLIIPAATIQEHDNIVKKNISESKRK